MESLAIHTVTSRSTSANEEAEELLDSVDVGRTETRDSDTDNEAEVGTDTTDLEDLFEEMSDKAEQTDGSYFPFPSKIFALLYLLLNSPHPMVIV